MTIRQADGDAVYGDQNTDGSNSIRSIFDDMRRVGATARMMLVAAAANRWKVAPGDCIAKDHKVTHVPLGRAFGFGELALEARSPSEKYADVTRSRTSGNVSAADYDRQKDSETCRSNRGRPKIDPLCRFAAFLLPI